MADDPQDPPENEDELLLTEEVNPNADPENGEEDEEIPAFGDAEPSEPESPTIRHMRTELSKAHRQIADLGRQVNAPKEEEIPDDLGPEPTLEEFDWDPDKFAAAIKERARKETLKAIRPQRPDRSAQDAQVAATRERIEQEKIALKKPDVEDAFDVVRETLTPLQQSLIVATVEPGNTAKLIYALYHHRDKLTALAAQGDDNIPRFIKEVAKLEGQLKMVKKRTPPQPDTPERGSGRISRQSPDKELKKLQDEADKTGDRSKVAAHMRSQRQPAR